MEMLPLFFFYTQVWVEDVAEETFAAAAAAVEIDAFYGIDVNGIYSWKLSAEQTRKKTFFSLRLFPLLGTS